MPTTEHVSNKNAPTHSLTVKDQKYAYRRFGSGPALPLLLLQHEDVMHLDKPRLSKFLQDPSFKGYGVLQKIFFDLTPTSQGAGEAFINRLMERKVDREPASGPEVAKAQMMAFRDWEKFTGERFADLAAIHQPTLVVNGIHDEMIPVRNSYWLVENLPNAVLMAYPDSGHGSLFQFHASFTGQAAAFLDSNSEAAPYRLDSSPQAKDRSEPTLG